MVTTAYSFSVNIWGIALEASLGWFFIKGIAEGELTNTNQSYLLFPYSYYKVEWGSLTAHTVIAALNLRYDYSLFRFKARIGAAHIFAGECSADIDYKKKILYGGESLREHITPIDPAGIGAAFIHLDAGISIPVRRIDRLKLVLGLQKAFVIPWGYEQLFGNEESVTGTADINGAADFFRTVLLSGLSVYCTLSF